MQLAAGSPVEVLTPDELVNAVAEALSVAPNIVQHWLSDEAMQAATAVPGGLDDTQRLVHERQVLMGQVEVLKRALSDLD